MSGEEMVNIMKGEEMVNVATTLARIRSDLVGAIEEQQRRRRRRRRLTGLVVGVMLVSGTAVASTTNFFTTAPDWVRGIFEDVPEVDEANAIKVGVIDDHVTYAAPAADGGFCIYYAPDERSGPSGIRCVEGGRAIPLTLEIGHDGGFVIGRVQAEGAASVDVTLPGLKQPASTPVVEHGFFLVELPDATMHVVMPGGVLDTAPLSSLSATARDAQGEEVARSDPYSWSFPEASASASS
jgi:hypothetical protein